MSFLINAPLPKMNWVSNLELMSEINNGRSIIRFGDGEVMLITGRNIHFQKSSHSLSLELKEVVERYSKDSKYLLCLPTEALTKSQIELKKNSRLRLWRLFRAFFLSRIKTDLPYGDAHAFYRKDTLNSLTPLLKHRHVISVSHQNTINNDFRRTMKKISGSTDFIIVSNKNAYRDKESVIKKLDEALKQNFDHRPLLLFAAGPVSKVLTHHYANKDIQAIDLGHGMEILTTDKDYTDRI